MKGAVLVLLMTGLFSLSLADLNYHGNRYSRSHAGDEDHDEVYLGPITEDQLDAIEGILTKREEQELEELEKELELQELEREEMEEMDKVLEELSREIEREDSIIKSRQPRSIETRGINLPYYLLHTTDEGEIRARVAQLFKFEEEMRKRMKKEQENQKLNQSILRSLMNGYVAFVGKIVLPAAKAIVNGRTSSKKKGTKSVDESKSTPAKPRYRRESGYEYPADEEQEMAINEVMDELLKVDGLLPAIYATRMDEFDSMADRADARPYYSASPEGAAHVPYSSDGRARRTFSEGNVRSSTSGRSRSYSSFLSDFF